MLTLCACEVTFFSPPCKSCRKMIDTLQGAASPVNLLRLIQTLCWKPALVEQRFDNGDVITNKNHVVQGKLARARLRATATIGFGTMRRKIELAAIR